MDSFTYFLSFSRWVDPAPARSERGEENAERGFPCPAPDSDLLKTRSLGELPSACQEENVRCDLTGMIRRGEHRDVPPNRRFPSSRCASTIQTVRPQESTTETQPQLQPAFLRLSA